MAIIFQPPGCGRLGGGNPATAASGHRINRRGTETRTFGQLLSFNFSFPQCIYLLLSKHKAFWRNGCAASCHPAADQNWRAQGGRSNCRSCNCWIHHLGDSPECHHLAYFGLQQRVSNQSSCLQVLGGAFSGFGCGCGCCDSFQANTPWFLLPSL